MTQEQLNHLIRRLADRTATPEETAALEDWYRSIHGQTEVEWPAAEPGEKEALQQRMLASLQRRLQDPGTEEDQATRIWLPRIRHIGPWVKAAACILLLAGIYLVARQSRQQAPVYTTIDNPTGKIAHCWLPDSSEVWLNAASSLRYANSFAARREVRLDGEGYFNVREDKAHPFVVHAGELTTTVLGTSFDIRSFAGEPGNAITVITGKVRVDLDSTRLDVLTPARQLQWDSRTRQSRTVSVDTRLVLGWQQGKLKFWDKSMEEIAGSLGRWYNMRFVFKDTAVKSCRLSGEFDARQSLQSILHVLFLTIDMHYVIDDKQRTVTLSGKGCKN